MPKWQVEMMRFGAHADLLALSGAAEYDKAMTALQTSDMITQFAPIKPQQAPKANPLPVINPLPATKELNRKPINSSSKLWVVCAYFNPCNYELRRANYLIFAERLLQQGVPLCTVELAQDKLQLEGIANAFGLHVPVFCDDVLWAKECLINIGARRLPSTCTIIVWADADLEWAQDDWAARTIAVLEQPNGPVVVQPFQRATKMKQHETFAGNYIDAPQSDDKACQPLGKAYALRQQSFVTEPNVYLYHAGYAWAMRREIFEAMGGLYIYCILGQADFVMAIAFTHDPQRKCDGEMPKIWNPYANFCWGPALMEHARDWQIKVSHIVRGRLAYVPDVHVFHNWHGDEHDRRYMKRGNIIGDYSPTTDVVLQANGTLAWTPAARARGMPGRVKQYFEERKEDGRPAEEVAERARTIELRKRMIERFRRQRF